MQTSVIKMQNALLKQNNLTCYRLIKSYVLFPELTVIGPSNASAALAWL